MTEPQKDELQAFYTKAPGGMPPTPGGIPTAIPGTTPGSVTQTPSSPQQSGTLKSSRSKVFVAILLLLAFIGVASTGVFIAQRQQQDPGPVAPTAPRSIPQAAEVISSDSCTIKWNVGPPPDPGVAMCDSKEAHSEFSDGKKLTVIPEYSIIEPGQEFVYKIQLSANPDTEEPIVVKDRLPDSVIFVEHANNSPEVVYDEQAHAVTAQIEQIKANQLVILQFMVKAVDEPEVEEFTNAAFVYTAESETDKCSWTLNFSPPSSPLPSPTPSPTPTPSPETYACDSPCTTDAQCQQVNAGYVCSQDQGNRCRLDTNRESATCQPKVDTYACNSSCQNDAQCQTVNPGYICDASQGNVCRLGTNSPATNCLPPNYTAPPPTVGCNALCNSNADCTASNHICFTVPDGTNRCRLESYVNSDTCTHPPSTVVQEQPVQQVVLPEELPRSGPEHWVTLLKVGLITIGIGAAILLLL
jgi:hypothetical protein